MPTCSPAQRTREQSLASSLVTKALPRAQACSSVAALNFGKKIWRGATWASSNSLACPLVSQESALWFAVSPPLLHAVVFKLFLSQRPLFQVMSSTEVVFKTERGGGCPGYSRG